MIGRRALAPVLGQQVAMSPSSTVYGGQHDTKYVTFELLLHAAFVPDEIWGFMLEPARIFTAFKTVLKYNNADVRCLPLLCTWWSSL